MPTATVNGVRLSYELTGENGPPLALLHGSWGDHHSWDLVAPMLAKHFRVLVYDRRGHSQSERPSGQSTADQHGDDLAALLDHLALAPAHLTGGSSGGYILLRLAVRCPDLFRSLAVHEPALFGLLAGQPNLVSLRQELRDREDAVIAHLETGDNERGARQFMETIAFGPGAWDQMPPQGRQTFINNAPTFLSDARDPAGFSVDLAALAKFPRPVLLTRGDQSPPYFAPIVDTLAAALPQAETRIFAGAGHVPYLTHPTEYATSLAEFVSRSAATGES